MARRRRFHEYPRVVYGPHGASMTIQRAEDWPAGWSASQDRDDPLPASTPFRVPLTRAEMKRQLRAAGIPFQESAADADLYKRLNDA